VGLVWPHPTWEYVGGRWLHIGRVPFPFLTSPALTPLAGENPLVILRCVCQQINCVRDKAGAIKEGAPDDIQSVHYGWAMEQDAAGTGVDGGPPKWIVREMMVQGMQAIV
jgi:hypothetical protein